MFFLLFVTYISAPWCSDAPVKLRGVLGLDVQGCRKAWGSGAGSGFRHFRVEEP